MSRYLILAIAPVLLLASCDPFDLVDPNPPYRQAGHAQQRGPAQQPPYRDQTDGYNDQSRPNPDQRADNRSVPERYPMAERTENPNQVLSPFPPYNVIDVTGFNPGQLARDPSNNEIFRIP